jgi:hypothetical protein
LSDLDREIDLNPTHWPVEIEDGQEGNNLLQHSEMMKM